MVSNQHRHFQSLLVVQPRIDIGLIRPGQIGLRNP